MPKMTSGRYPGAHYGETFTEIVPTKGPPKMTKQATQAAEPSASPFSEEDFAKIGIALGNIDAALLDLGIAEADLPNDPLELVKFAAAVAAEQKAASLAGQRIPKGARSPLRRNALGLSQRELDMCREKKLDPAAYVAKRAAMKARSPKGGAR